MDEKVRDQIGEAIGRIPSGLFILTARSGDKRTGMLASWVQQACFEPPMVCVAIGRGRPITPLIGESHQFGLCQLPKDDKLYMRRFAGGVDPGDDPMLGLELVEKTRTCAPILARSLAYLECEVAVHVDVEGDHELFVGRIVGGRFIGGEPLVHVRKNGFKY